MTVKGGYHFPMCDAPDQVAGWIRQWHAAADVPRGGPPAGPKRTT